jgi:asparagine synthase (glutamine-hydrolysing)
MGAISFLMYNMSKPPIDINFAKHFIKMKNRGENDTQIITESSPTITSLNINQISNYLSKREIYEYKPFTFEYGYHRLSINDISLDGSQPFQDPIPHKLLKYPELKSRPKRKLLCNGEIYNYNQLLEKNNFTDRDLQSQSDVEIIIPLYIKYLEESKIPVQALEKCLGTLNGDYSFILTENTNTFDLKNINIFAVRDPWGTKPLYMIKYTPLKSNQNTNETGLFYMFVSELKGIPTNLLNNPEYSIVEIPPGTYWSYQNSIINKNTQEFIPYYDFNKFKDLNSCVINTANPETISKLYRDIQNLLTQSIICRYELSHQNVGLLLSGGFDSCILTSILVKYLVEKYNYSKPLHVFTIGNENNKDVVKAKEHVELLEKTYNIDIHHHVIQINNFNLITTEIDNIIFQIESFDSTTIRKSIPMAFLLKYIKSYTDVRVLLSGEGLDELCGHHELFELDNQEFQNKSINLLQNLSKFDLLRNDKIAGSYGLEIRYPFLDISFVEYILSVHPLLKRPQISGYTKNPIEKYIIRKSFDTNENIIINKDILWNHKQDISSSLDNSQKLNFTDQLIHFYNNKYTDSEYFYYLQIINSNPTLHTVIPNTKEEMHYKKTFDKYYPNISNILPYYWNSLF